MYKKNAVIFFPLEMQQIFFKDGLEFSLEIGFFLLCVLWVSQFVYSKVKYKWE